MNKYKSRDGFVVLSFPILLVMFLSLAGFVLQLGLAHITKAQMQTIDDASSLAGASTAEVEKDLQMSSDLDGNIVVQEIPTGVKINDFDKANNQALKAAVANGLGSSIWKTVGADYSSSKTGVGLNDDETGWSGEVTGKAQYTTHSRIKLAPGLLKFLGSEGMTITTDGDGEAFLSK